MMTSKEFSELWEKMDVTQREIFMTGFRLAEQLVGKESQEPLNPETPKGE